MCFPSNYNRNDKFCTLSLVLLVTCLLSLGISAAVFVSSAKHLGSNCEDIIGVFIAGATINFITAIVTLQNIHGLIDGSAFTESRRTTFLFLCYAAHFCLSLAIVIKYHIINSICYDFWFNNMYQFIVVGAIHYVIFLIYCLLFVIWLLISCYNTYTQSHHLLNDEMSE